MWTFQPFRTKSRQRRFRLREAQHHWCEASLHLPKATSFEATPQHRSFVPRAAMMFSLRSKWCCVCHANDVVPNGTNEKIQLFRVGFFGRGRRTWTHDTQFWRLVFYRLNYTPIFVGNIPNGDIISQTFYFCKGFLKKSCFFFFGFPGGLPNVCQRSRFLSLISHAEPAKGKPSP